MILVSMERGDPTLYHGTKQTYFGPVKFKFIRGVVTTPLGKPCYKKGLVGRGLMPPKEISMEGFSNFADVGHDGLSRQD